MLDYRMDTFLSLCETKSYTRTAEQLHLTQPSVTQHIKYLEQVYQCRLFLYDGRKVNMTDEGKYLRDKIQIQFSQEAEIRKHLSRMQNSVQLRIGVTATAAMSPLLEQLCMGVRADNMESHQIQLFDTKTLLQKLLSCELDAALLEGENQERLLSYTPLLEEKIIAVSNVPNAERLYGCTWNQLLHETLLIPEPGTGLRNMIQRSLSGRGFSIYDFAKIVEINSFVVMKELLRQGKGVAFVFESTAQKEREKEELGRVYIDTLSSIYGSLNFVCLRSREEEEKLSLVRDALLDRIKAVSEKKKMQ